MITKIMKPLRSYRNTWPQPIRHKLLQAKPKIWEALGAKPIRHKLLQAKPKIWEALGAKPDRHELLRHPPPDQVARRPADQYLHGATLVVTPSARVLEMPEVVP